MGIHLEQIHLYHKIHIIGGAGSGKTTLSGWISEQLGIPKYNLDGVAWNKAGKVPLDQRVAKLDEILAQPMWVTEGAFLWWTDPLLKGADVIIYLDMPFPLNAWRMIKRHALASWRGNNPHSGLRKLAKFVISVGKNHYRKEPLEPKAVDDDFSITRAGTLIVLSEYEDKVLRCYKPSDVVQVQKGLLTQIQ